MHSIHCILSLEIKVKPPPNKIQIDSNLETLCKYRWKEGDENNFLKAMTARSIQSKINHFNDQDIPLDAESINSSILNITNIILETCDSAGIKKTGMKSVPQKIRKKKKF